MLNMLRIEAIATTGKVLQNDGAMVLSTAPPSHTDSADHGSHVQERLSSGSSTDCRALRQ